MSSELSTRNTSRVPRGSPVYLRRPCFLGSKISDLYRFGVLRKTASFQPRAGRHHDELQQNERTHLREEVRMTRVIDSDHSVTPDMCQRVLDKVEEREGPEFVGWNRTNPVLTRKASWEIFRNAARSARGKGLDFLNVAVACNIRREFGTDGSKKALKAPFKRRHRRQERWT